MKTYEYSRKETGMTIKQDLKAAQKEFKELGKKHRKVGQGNWKVRESTSEKDRHQKNQKRKGETKIDSRQETNQKETRYKGQLKNKTLSLCYHKKLGELMSATNVFQIEERTVGNGPSKTLYLKDKRKK